MKFLTALTLAALALSPAAFGQAQGVDRSATSTITTRQEKDGSITAVLTNRRFTFASLPPERDGAASRRALLLLEEFKSEQNSAAEGRKSFVSVEAWSGEGANAAKPAWTISSEGDEGALAERFYKVMRRGCCGAEDTFIFYNPESGRKVFSATGDLFQIEVPNTPLRRFVAYHSMMASMPMPLAKPAKNALGVITYGSDKEALQSVLVRSTAKNAEDTGTPIVKALYRQKIVAENPLVLWGADKKNNPSSLGDFSLVLSFDQGQEIIIPVRGDRLDVKTAKLARGVALETLVPGK
jgi:hypothetical protein